MILLFFFFSRIFGSGSAQTVGLERQHHRLSSKERSPQYGVRPDSVCVVWVCGGTWCHCYLQNLWVLQVFISLSFTCTSQGRLCFRNCVIYSFTLFLQNITNWRSLQEESLKFWYFLFTAPLGYVSNFKVTSYTSTSIDVEWSPIVGATEYKLTWKTGRFFW